MYEGINVLSPGSGLALASKIISQLVPFHSTMSLAPATKSILLSPFQASAPSTFEALPISFNNNNLFPFCLILYGLYVVGSTIKSTEPLVSTGPTITVSVGIVSSSQVTSSWKGFVSFTATVPITGTSIPSLCRDI